MHGALIDAEILTSPLPHVFAQFSPVVWVLALCPWASQHLSSGLEMFLCVSETSKQNLVYGALIETEILTPSHIYLLKLAQFWVLALCPQVGQHLPSGLQMFLCVSGTSKKFGTWKHNEK